MNGTGHGDLFQDAKGNWHYVFHVHNSDTEVHDRRTAIVDIKFEPNEATGIDDVIVDSKSLLLLKQK